MQMGYKGEGKRDRHLYYALRACLGVGALGV